MLFRSYEAKILIVIITIYKSFNHIFFIHARTENTGTVQRIKVNRQNHPCVYEAFPALSRTRSGFEPFSTMSLIYINLDLFTY
ncbi:hypothetical protein [Cytobacillus sp. AMY 15.2]|uniref:hypothetical protein n=1 Tax=Cytobacillus sp. AMY 15.2 TaxID=2939563 RepID=UPI00203D2E80|nr:hypothetical protein [Cytobacillus sp. AMY 15.2]